MTMTMSSTYRTQRLYTFSEAARLARVSTSTVRNWLFGYVARNRETGPLFQSQPDQAMVSFLQMIEITVAARFRKEGHVPFKVVRQGYDNAREFYGLEYPFAHLQLESIGGHIVQRLHGDSSESSLQTIDSPEQWTLPGLVLEVIQQLDYEDGLAARWYPVGKDFPIVVDPKISSGAPTFKGRGVTLSVVRKRWKAGQPIEFIAEDFQIDRDVIEKTLQYGEQIAA